jgi:hypothetical protein
VLAHLEVVRSILALQHHILPRLPVPTLEQVELEPEILTPTVNNRQQSKWNQKNCKHAHSRESSVALLVSCAGRNGALMGG